MKNTNIYFIRHAQAVHTETNNRIRPLTEKGIKDRELVTKFLMDKDIEAVLSSPYRRAIDTVADFTATAGLSIELVEDFKEFGKDSRADLDYVVPCSEFVKTCKRHWADFNYRNKQSETFFETQFRNIEALKKVLVKYVGKNIVIGTHGTALALIINFYDKSFGFDSFVKMIELIPWCMKMSFQESELIEMSSFDFSN